MELVLDDETRITEETTVNQKGKEVKRKDYSPYHPDNFLVSIGVAFRNNDRGWDTEYHFFDHTELPVGYDSSSSFKRIQELLDKTTLLIGHNIKYDLTWLWECGFKYTGKVYDTLLCEYVLSRGYKGESLSLAASCERRNTDTKKEKDLVQEYLDKKITFDKIPMEIVKEYGELDCISTGELYDKQLEVMKEAENVGLQKTLDLTNAFCYVLSDMEFGGVNIDMDALDMVEFDFRREKKEIERELNKIAEEKMGRPINLSSPLQLSELIYSRRILDRHWWNKKWIGDKGRPINRNMNIESVKKIVAKQMEPVLFVTPKKCDECDGIGYIRKIKKNGHPFKNPTKCKRCDTKGVIYVRNKEKLAGFGFPVRSAKDITSNGFGSDKETLLIIKDLAAKNGLPDLVNFCEKMVRYNALETYLGTYVGGIRKGIRSGTTLHGNFNQSTTSTGRLSSSEPNLQNQPRSKTFPIKKVIVSKFPGGKIIDTDFSQLEFRAAAHMGKDGQAIADILQGVDIHAFTRDTLRNAGLPLDKDDKVARQESKSRTFKPLYGGTYGSPPEMEYYRAFLEKYEGIANWHKELQEESIKTKKVILPTGREYAFPYSNRMWHGGSSQKTRVVNYPVQGFATADIVPLAIILIYFAIENLKSRIILTVHDSIAIDAHPDEIEEVKIRLSSVLSNMNRAIKDMWDIDMLVPLDSEAGIGDNWMETKEFTLYKPDDTVYERAKERAGIL